MRCELRKMEKIETKKDCLTVSQIAKRANVSRNQAWSYIRRNDIKPIKKQGKYFLFDSKLIDEIVETHSKKQLHEDNTLDSFAILKMLEKQIEVKDQQIEALQKDNEFFKNEVLEAKLRISKQQKEIADSHERLLAISKNDLKNDETTAKTPKKHWWQRLF